MASIINDLKKVFKIGYDAPTVSSVILFMSRICMVVTFTACVLLTTKYFVGVNIRCMTDSLPSGAKGERTAKAIETYCYFMSTFTHVDDQDSGAVNATIHPGVGPKTKDVHQRHHKYYQWVPIVLLLQTLIFYIPNSVWEGLNGGFFRSVCCSLSVFQLGDTSKHVKDSAKYFVASLNIHSWTYGVAFILCECLVFGLSVANLFFTNIFLGGEFFSYGSSSFMYLMQDGAIPSKTLNEIFPKMTKCTWRQFGPSGSIKTLDSLCVLPLNIVNEKIYVFLWIVYLFSTIICAIILLVHIFLMFIPDLRNSFVMCRAKGKEKRALYTILSSCQFGDWLLLYHLQSSMVYFREWVMQVEQNLMEKRKFPRDIEENDNEKVG